MGIIAVAFSVTSGRERERKRRAGDKTPNRRRVSQSALLSGIQPSGILLSGILPRDILHSDVLLSGGILWTGIVLHGILHGGILLSSGILLFRRILLVIDSLLLVVNSPLVGTQHQLTQRRVNRDAGLRTLVLDAMVPVDV